MQRPRFHTIGRFPSYPFPTRLVSPAPSALDARASSLPSHPNPPGEASRQGFCPGPPSSRRDPVATVATPWGLRSTCHFLSEAFSKRLTRTLVLPPKTFHVSSFHPGHRTDCEFVSFPDRRQGSLLSLLFRLESPAYGRIPGKSIRLR